MAHWNNLQLGLVSKFLGWAPFLAVSLPKLGVLGPDLPPPSLRLAFFCAAAFAGRSILRAGQRGRDSDAGRPSGCGCQREGEVNFCSWRTRADTVWRNYIWAWVKIKPGIGAQVLVFVSIYQGPTPISMSVGMKMAAWCTLASGA